MRRNAIEGFFEFCFTVFKYPLHEMVCFQTILLKIIVVLHTLKVVRCERHHFAITDTAVVSLPSFVKVVEAVVKPETTWTTAFNSVLTNDIVVATHVYHCRPVCALKLTGSRTVLGIALNSLRYGRSCLTSICDQSPNKADSRIAINCRISMQTTGWAGRYPTRTAQHRARGHS